MDRLPVEKSALTELVALWWGSAHPMTHTLLRNLARTENDAGWRRDILAGMRPWRVELEWEAARAGPPSAAGLAQDAPEPADDAPDAALAKEADDRAMAAFQRLHESRDSPGGWDLASAVSSVRSIAQAHPASAQAHYVAGSHMGMAGKWLARDDLVNEGVGECWIAAQLRPVGRARSGTGGDPWQRGQLRGGTVGIGAGRALARRDDAAPVAVSRPCADGFVQTQGGIGRPRGRTRGQARFRIGARLGRTVRVCVG